MKFLISIVMLMPSFSLAVVCHSSNPLVKKYHEQRTLKEAIVSEPGIAGSVPLYINQKGEALLDSLNQRISGEADIKVEQTNSNFKDFFKLCKMKLKKRKLLSTYRRSNDGNKYRLSLQILPTLNEFQNSPYDQLRIQSIELDTKYESDSIMNSSIDVKEDKKEIHTHLLDQLVSNKKVDTIEFDLTNFDDFACDLATGRAKVSVFYRYNGTSPIINRAEKISKDTVYRLYQNLANELDPSQDKDSRIFRAGMIYADLVQMNSSHKAKQSTVMKALKGFMGEDYKTFKNYGLTELQCLSDSLQEYYIEPVNHLINVEIKLNQEKFFSQGEL